MTSKDIESMQILTGAPTIEDIQQIAAGLSLISYSMDVLQDAKHSALAVVANEEILAVTFGQMDLVREDLHRRATAERERNIREQRAWRDEYRRAA